MTAPPIEKSALARASSHPNDVHDGTPGLDQVGPRRARATDGAVEFQGEPIPPIFFRQLKKVPPFCGPRIVDEKIDSSEFFNRKRDQFLWSIFIAQINRKRHGIGVDSPGAPVAFSPRMPMAETHFPL